MSFSFLLCHSKAACVVMLFHSPFFSPGCLSLWCLLMNGRCLASETSWEWLRCVILKKGQAVIWVCVCKRVRPIICWPGQDGTLNLHFRSRFHWDKNRINLPNHSLSSSETAGGSRDSHLQVEPCITEPLAVCFDRHKTAPQERCQPFRFKKC